MNFLFDPTQQPHLQAQVDQMWTDWLIPGLIPFTIPKKDTTLLRIDMKAKPLHAQ